MIAFKNIKNEELLVKTVDFTVKSTTLEQNFQKAKVVTIENCQFDGFESLQKILTSFDSLETVRLRDPILLTDKLKPLVANRNKRQDKSKLLDLDFLNSVFLFSRGLGDMSWLLMNAVDNVLQFQDVHLKFCIDRYSYKGLVLDFLQNVYQNYGKVWKGLEIVADADSCLKDIIKYMTDTMSDQQLDSLKLDWSNEGHTKTDDELLQRFLGKHPKLKTLQISVLGSLENELAIIADGLKELEELSVTFDTLNDVQCFNEPIRQLKKLKHLKIEATGDSFLGLSIPPHLIDFEFSTFDLQSIGFGELRLSPATELLNITKIVLKFVVVRNDVLLEIFEHMPNLRHLELFRNKHLYPVNFYERGNRTMVANQSIGNLKKLEYLQLDSCYINETVLFEISAPNLVTFMLWCYRIGMDTVMTKRGLNELSKNCPKLKEICDCRGKVMYKVIELYGGKKWECLEKSWKKSEK